MTHDELVARFFAQGAAHYIVVREDQVVQEIVAQLAIDAEKQQTEEGLLYVQCGGQV